MLGCEDYESRNDILDAIENSINDAYDLWGKASVILLIEAQKEQIGPNQILENLVKKFALSYASSNDILLELQNEKKLVIDSSVLIDERLSFLIVSSFFSENYHLEKPVIVIPNIVTFEIKSMLDRKDNQYQSGNDELLKLRALSDIGFISTKYVGEIPLLPPIAKTEKGTWIFEGSLKDEYILKVLGELPDSTLLTSDGRLARSAYVRGYDVIKIKPLIQEIKEQLAS